MSAIKPISRLSLSQAEHIWNTLALQNNAPMPMLSFEWYKAWIMVNSMWEPYILFIDETAIAPFVRKGTTVQFTHGYTDFNDLINPSVRVWSRVIDYLRSENIQNIELENIPHTSESIHFFQHLASKDVQQLNILPAKTAPFIDLPQNFEDYISTIKVKRKKYNKFKREYPKALITTSTNLEKDLGKIIELMRLDSNKEMNPIKENFFKLITDVCRKYVWIQLLHIDTEIIACLYLFVHNAKVMFYIS